MGTKPVAQVPSGTLLPTMSGTSAMWNCSCPFSPMLSLVAKFFGISCGLSSLSECWYGNVRICVFRYSRVKYFRQIILRMHKANSTGTILSNMSWSISGGKPVIGWKCCNALLREHSPVTPKWVAFSHCTTFCTCCSTFVLIVNSVSETSLDWSTATESADIVCSETLHKTCKTMGSQVISCNTQHSALDTLANSLNENAILLKSLKVF